MRRISIFACIAILIGFGIGLGAQIARTAVVAPNDSRAADLAAIEKLHQEDIAATLTQDPADLTKLWSDDGVNLGVPGAPAVGIKAIGELYAKFRTEYPEFKVLKYAPVITDVKITDGWAIEVGNTTATYKMSAKDAPIDFNEKGMRVLKRQSDGSWKFAVVGLK